MGTPFTGEIVADSANCMRARGTLNFANRMPVVSATSDTPTMTSLVTSAWAASLCGYRTPYPIVPIVCTLKKKWSASESGRAPATPPTAR